MKNIFRFIAHKKQNPKGKTRGFTLVEVILYVAFTGIVLLAAGSFSVQILLNRSRQISISEVTYNANFALLHVADAVSTALSVESPAEGEGATTLSLRTMSSSTDPILFYVEDGILKEQAGTSTSVALTTHDVVVRSLTLQNVSYAGSPSAIHIAIDIAHVNPNQRAESEFVQTFYTTAVVRHSK